MRQIESFFWGIIAALGALFIQLVIFIVFSSFPSYATATFSTFYYLPSMIVAAAFLEELFKYIVIAKRVDNYSFAKNYIFNSLLVGLGFFAAELGLISYSQNFFDWQILELAIIHMSAAALTGYIIAINNPKKISTFIKAIFLTTFFHSCYNFLTLQHNRIENYAIYSLLGLLVAITTLNTLRISKRLAT